jgi:hypothetical protein
VKIPQGIKRGNGGLAAKWTCTCLDPVRLLLLLPLHTIYSFTQRFLKLPPKFALFYEKIAKFGGFENVRPLCEQLII